MGFVVLCESCKKRLSIPPTLYERKVRGRVVTVTCRFCQAAIRIDATSPLARGSVAPRSQRPLAAPVPPSSRRSTSTGPGRPGGVLEDPGNRFGSNDDASVLELLELGQPRIPRGPPVPKAVGLEGPWAIALETEVPNDALPIMDAEPATGSGVSENWESVLEGSAPEGSPLVVRMSESTGGQLSPRVHDEKRTQAEPYDSPALGRREPESESSVPAADPPSAPTPIASIGRYTLFNKFATGGMATVHFGRLDGAGGFSRVVALKRLLPHLVQNDEFVEMLLKEARLAGRVRHPNVVQTLDVVASKDDVLIVLEYVPGESLSALCRILASRRQQVEVEIATSIMIGALRGLHAVHEASDEHGRILGLVHRDVSPANVIVGIDGLARVLDFGIVKALELVEETMPNRVKGKTGYMSPEQARGERVTRRSDIFSAGIVFWELLTLRRFAAAKNDKERVNKILSGRYEPPSSHRPGLSQTVDQVMMKALAFDPEDRFATTREFAEALESASTAASSAALSDFVNELAVATLMERARRVAQIETWSGASAQTLSSSAYAAETAILKASAPPAPAEEVAQRGLSASAARPQNPSLGFSVLGTPPRAKASGFRGPLAVLLVLSLGALVALALLKPDLLEGWVSVLSLNR